MFKFNNEDTTSVSTVGLNRFLFVGYAVSAKASQLALVYSKSITQTAEQGAHLCCPWCFYC